MGRLEMDGGEGDKPPESSEQQIPAKPKPKKQFKDGKVVILLNAVGDAPLLKQNKFKAQVDKPFAYIVAHIRKQLHLTESDEPLFVFCNSSFVPCLDDKIEDLATAFHVNNQ